MIRFLKTLIVFEDNVVARCCRIDSRRLQDETPSLSRRCRSHGRERGGNRGSRGADARPGGTTGSCGRAGPGRRPRPRTGARRTGEAQAHLADDAEFQFVPEKPQQPESNARPDAYPIRPAQDVRGDVRRPSHRVSAFDHRPVRDRSSLHQGAEGEARRAQGRDDPDQPGVRHRPVDFQQRRGGPPAGRRPREAVDRHRGPVPAVRA